ncbi:PD-(D/E)XK nuclease family protein [Vulcanisaeta sp. JCM 14467]|uniref:PD-(D/E)XK nuclease family protein n=1 Tax=Vulcanisaeta sp. JCM 14467 TaxID=1295370 RepID=UPI0006D11195|nr:PD-(D/E)XK nuclease family protein [Vulcanisaeta sp. JCM 14467]
MSLADEIKRVLMENPNILIEVLLAKPEIIYQALAKLTPWQNLATKQDVEELRKEIEGLRREIQDIRSTMATKKDLEELRKEMATKKDLEELRKYVDDKVEELRREMATKRELEELRKEMATKKELDDLRKEVRLLANKLDALGARWGVLSEEAFREGVREILKDAGYTVERWLYYDADGFVYGHPSEVELDIIIRDNLVIAVEITSAVKRSDLAVTRRKAELYMKTTGKSVSMVMVITPYIDDKNPDYVRVMAERMGIKIITPEDMTKQTQ